MVEAHLSLKESRFSKQRWQPGPSGQKGVMFVRSKQHIIWFSTQTGQPSHHIFFETPAAPFFSPSKIKPHIESVYGFATAGTVTEKGFNQNIRSNPHPLPDHLTLQKIRM